MGIIRTGMIDDDGTGTTGTIFNNAWKQELYGQIDSYVQGAWNAKSFLASDWSVPAGSTITITAGNVARDAWLIIGKTVFFDLRLTGVTLGGTAPIQVTRAPYPGGSISKVSSGPLIHNNAGGIGQFVTVVGTPGQINLLRDWVGTAWTVGPWGIAVQGCYELA